MSTCYGVCMVINNNMVYSGFTQAGKLEEESGRTSAAAALYIEIGKAGITFKGMRREFKKTKKKLKGLRTTKRQSNITIKLSNHLNLFFFGYLEYM